VLILIAVNVLAGLLTFRDYGYSLDEPLYYGYADALGYAYSPVEWFSPDFDLERAYGPSPWDHRNRGPAYLLLTRGPAHLLQAMGLDQASAWHLINFLAFQAGIYFFYVFCRRWMGPWAAFAATALFSTQPVFWEHAFINPKDPSFMFLFLIALEMGFRMADRMAVEQPISNFGLIKLTILPGILLGLAAGVRILGPFAGLLVVLYFVLLKRLDRLPWLVPYGLVAISAMIATWPYLWEGPVTKFLETLKFMSDNPTTLRVLFYGQLYRADQLPIRYLPVMFLYTLTEPVWFLAALGALAAVIRWRKNDLEWKSLLAAILWFAVPFAYVILKRPPMYDGFRHFMFILPAIFVLGGVAMEAIFARLKPAAWRSLAIALLISPGLIAGIKLHPYEYTYYNQFAGGTDQASYNFETDYWLTCYKDAIERLNEHAYQDRTLFVRREGSTAYYYAAERIRIVDTSKESTRPHQGDYILEHSRAHLNFQKNRTHADSILIGRDNAVFCMIEKYTQK
jgi:4-amino-4-deoxy-L-arabinose transferase-like glycosyltransferase